LFGGAGDIQHQRISGLFCATSDMDEEGTRLGDADRGSSPLSITEIPQLTAGVGAR
jgi:hypothetical protein